MLVSPEDKEKASAPPESGEGGGREEEVLDWMLP
jgi:hypothetical protein